MTKRLSCRGDSLPVGQADPRMNRVRGVKPDQQTIHKKGGTSFRMMRSGGGLCQSHKPLDCQPRLMNNRAQCSPIQLLVIWYNQLGEWLVSSENEVTTVLSPLDKSHLRKSFCTLPTGNSWKRTHTAIRIVSNFSGGTGSLSSWSVET